MPIYKVWGTNTERLGGVDIEAKCEETAQEKYEDMFNNGELVVKDNMVESEAELSDNQYTDQQELRDRERDSEIWKI